MLKKGMQRKLIQEFGFNYKKLRRMSDMGKGEEEPSKEKLIDAFENAATGNRDFFTFVERTLVVAGVLIAFLFPIVLNPTAYPIFQQPLFYFLLALANYILYLFFFLSAMLTPWIIGDWQKIQEELKKISDKLGTAGDVLEFFHKQGWYKKNKDVLNLYARLKRQKKVQRTSYLVVRVDFFIALLCLFIIVIASLPL